MWTAMVQLLKQKVHGQTQELMDATIAVTLATQVKKGPSLSARGNFSVATDLTGGTTYQTKFRVLQFRKGEMSKCHLPFCVPTP